MSAGNLPEQPTADYLSEIETAEIQDPAQAWNVLTVGASTDKVDIGAGP